jgi:hypothetical protein
MKTRKERKGQSTRTGNAQSRLDRDKIPQRLPQIEDQLAVGKTLRFITTGIGATSSTTVTFANLLDAWLIAGTSTTAYQLFDFVKIRRVTVRAISSRDNDISTGPAGSASVGVEFPGLVAGSNAGGNQASNSNMGTTFPAYVSLKPAKMSASAFFQPSSNAVAFVVRASNQDGTPVLGAVVDVELSFKNSADVSPAAISSPIAAATSGQLYYGGIDGGRLAATWARSAFLPRI